VVDVDRLVRESLQRRADEAPGAEWLLAAVHLRSDRLRQRRRTWARSMAVVGVALLAGAVPAAAQLVSPAPRSANPGHGEASASRWSATPSAPAASASPANPDTTTTQLRLAPPAYSTPAFPFRPDLATGLPKGGLRTPVITLDGGALQGFFEAKDGVRGADVTIVVTAQRPTFGAAAGPVSEAGRQVRGHPGILRTVAVSPAAQLNLYWQESATQWVQVRTDDTFTEAEVVQFANALVAAALPLDLGLRLDLAPVGLVLDSASLSTVALRPGDVPAGSGAAGAIVCTLYDTRPLSGTAVSVGAYRGAITRTASGVSLAVNIDDRGVTLLVQVPARYAISDADLIRFAAGVRLTDRAESSGR
jgi:hypothetical protein